MKILQVIPYFSWEHGGPVKVVHDLSIKLAKKGHEVSIYTTNVGLNGPLRDDQKIKSNKIKITYFNCLNNFLANNLKLHLSPEMRKAIKNNIDSFDIVHLHEWRGVQNLYVQKYAKKYKIPFILQPHGASPRIIDKQNFIRTITKIPFDIFLGKRIINNSFKIIVVSEFEKRLLINNNISSQKIEIIPNGFDSLEYLNLPHKNQFKCKFNISKNEKIILYLGRINKMKGVDILVKSFSQIVKKHDNFRLVIVGPDEGFRFYLEKMIESYKLIDKVIFTGPLFNKKKLSVLVDADVLVYPSKYEIFGLVPFEALMCNTPVIVSTGTGCSELILASNSGISFEYGNTYQLTDKILELVDNKELSKLLVLNGKTYVNVHMNLDNIINKLELVYTHARKNYHNN